MDLWSGRMALMAVLFGGMLGVFGAIIRGPEKTRNRVDPLSYDRVTPALDAAASEADASEPEPDVRVSGARLSEAPAEQTYPGLLANTLVERNPALLLEMREALGLDPAQVESLQRIFEASRWLGQGNPAISKHPMTRQECREARARVSRLTGGDPRCLGRNMVALYGREQRPEDARVCIDQYEFPNIPCEYPLVWVRASEAVELCRAVGKRICDAHEWEGACAGALNDPGSEYAFGERRMMMEYLHNKTRELVWAYGSQRDHSRCATGSRKSPKCDAVSYAACGSNTYPAGAFPQCQSPFGVYDLHGNAAEHMNLPERLEELASRGGLGQTEMKGSWFVFGSQDAHPDDCRWRAPMWHATRIDDPNSHRNYHLGFRCCRDITPAAHPQ